MRSSVLLLSSCLFFSCTRTVDNRPFNKNLTGKWVLTDMQSAGNGTPGIWSVAAPPGKWFEFYGDSTIGGTVFIGATRYSVLDSATLRIYNPTLTAGFDLYNYYADTASRSLYFYLRPANGGYCIEGCGTLKFKR